ncbi:dihydroorotase [Nocardioides bigeumensis]|uniref:Dihydropyrimidinase n=1 Tax=Nocardioides bigeumensis TaxID=433657 RepID=A0ABN2Y816_9ACTN
MTMEQFDIVIKGGTVVSGQGETQADVGIQGETIAAVGPDLRGGAARVIDARNKLVLPGVIDAHTHPVYTDDMAATCRAGASGGVTTILSFVGAFPSWGFPKTTPSEVVGSFVDAWSGQVACDFGLHAAFDAADDVAAEVPKLVAAGVSSFKFFMAYRARNMMVDDRSLIEGMKVIADHGGIAIVHAENGDGIEYFESQFWDQADVPHATYLHCHTPLFETEATLRAIALADAVGCPLYVPHLAVAEGITAIELGRRTASTTVWVETCPHYLLLTNREVIERGALSKIAPPIRLERDNESLWRGVADGTIQTIATDHAARTVEIKSDAPNLLQAPYGAEGIEHLLPLTYSEGVRGGRISLQRMVQVLSENPADIFGLSPRKGRILPGADADVVVLDPAGEALCTAERHVGSSDYCLYEGQRLVGKVTETLRRGHVVVDGGKLVDDITGGRYVPRSAFRQATREDETQERRTMPVLS